MRNTPYHTQILFGLSGEFLLSSERHLNGIEPSQHLCQAVEDKLRPGQDYVPGMVNPEYV